MCGGREWHRARADHDRRDDDRGVDVPIGHAAPGSRLLVLDEYGGLTPSGAWGELYVRRPGMATGYLHLPEATAERFVVLPCDERGQPLGRTLVQRSDVVSAMAAMVCAERASKLGTDAAEGKAGQNLSEEAQHHQPAGGQLGVAGGEVGGDLCRPLRRDEDRAADQGARRVRFPDRRSRRR